MPRFGAEEIPNALQEQIYREILKGMTGKEPLSGSDNLFANEYIQEFSQDPDIRGPEMQYGSIEGPITFERMRRPETFDDTKTQKQSDRDNRAMAEAYAYSRTPMYSPLHQNSLERPNGNEIGDAPRGVGPMNRMYNQMPPNIPRYPMMEMPPPDQSPQMDQLMEFYTDEGV